MSRTLLILLPNRDFDPTEVCIPWKECSRHGLQPTFATPDGQPAECDPLLITGVIFGLLGASPKVIALYRELVQDPSFRNPIAYAGVQAQDFEALLLPGGHAQGMKSYLGSPLVQSIALHFMKTGKVVGAICHGPLVLARTVDPETGRSVLHNRRATALPWIMEFAAYCVTAWKLGRYYRTYPAYVQDEMVSALGHRSRFRVGNPLAKVVVEDANLITARWPGDAEVFAQRLAARI